MPSFPSPEARQCLLPAGTGSQTTRTLRSEIPNVRASASALLGFALLALLSQTAFAATIDVTTTTDELNSDGDCSLREAIRSANTDAAVDACTAGSGADTINIPAGTYTLSLAGGGEDDAATGDLDINSSLTLTGAGAASTVIDASDLDRVFDVDPKAVGGLSVQISAVTIQNGSANTGAGVNLSGLSSLTLSNCVITSNDGTSAILGGGGITTAGDTLTIRQCTISNNTAARDGGGINSAGMMLVLEDSTVSGNSAADTGGGIANYRPAAISRSTISGNSAVARGGGIYDASTLITLLNSTISGNSSNFHGGGVAHDGVTLNLYNVTITDNTADADSNGTGDGGGLFFNGGTLNIKNSILAANGDKGGQAPDCDGTATLTSQGDNIVGDNTGCDFSEVAGDQEGTGASPIAPLLSFLADNGGPTQTHALLTGSPAIDAGDPAGCKDQDGNLLTTDQRGFVRPTDGDGDGNARCDIGAVEIGCGNGVLETTEVCDDGNASNTDSCLNTCQSASCGDGFVQTTVEGCDDGNADDADACRNSCVSATCGDGVVQASVEACDSGGANSDITPDACRTNCANPACGDGVTDTSEECDDGNTAAGDGCSATCTTEATEPTAECGNGTQEGDEACDDGNTEDLDGCDSSCATETFSELEADNPDIDFDNLTVGESLLLNAPDPTASNGPNLTLLAAADPDLCSCQWDISPATRGSFDNDDECVVNLSLEEAGQAKLSVAVSCGTEGSGTYNQTLNIKAAPEEEGGGGGGGSGGCSLLPLRERSFHGKGEPNGLLHGPHFF